MQLEHTYFDQISNDLVFRASRTYSGTASKLSPPGLANTKMVSSQSRSFTLSFKESLKEVPLYIHVSVSRDLRCVYNYDI